MQVLKKRLKNSLSNKILKSQLVPYNIFYVIIDSSQTITKSFKKKIFTKLLFFKNFNLLKNSSFIYPICYTSSDTLDHLLKTYTQLKQNNDFKKILICNIKAKSLIFKNINALHFYNVNNSLVTFYKLYLMLNMLVLNFIFSKKNIK
jgi:hypothetical protein